MANSTYYTEIYEQTTMDWIGTHFENTYNNETTETIKPEDLLSYQIAFGLHGYILPVVVFIGLIGNSLSFLVMIKPRNRRIGCYNYMAALAISDNSNLILALDYWTLIFGKRKSNGMECQIVAWLFQAVALSSMCFVMSMTVDRFLAIRYPLKAKTLCSVRRARITITCITIGVIIYTLPYFFTSGLLSDNRTCVAVATKDKLSVVYNWLNIFLGSVIPFISLLSMNVVIIRTIRKRGKYLKSYGNADHDTTSVQEIHTDTKIELELITGNCQSEQTRAHKDNEQSARKTISKTRKRTVKQIRVSRDKQLTMMLLLVTFTFLLLTLPQYVRYLVAILWNYTTSPQDYANYILLVHISNKLFFLNSGCNFFLYCLSGRKFRQDLMRLFTCKR